MIPDYLAPIANHLWQSTLFAAAAGLLTLMLRNNRAAVRYALWLAASAKFLIPFALVVAVGRLFEWHQAAAIVPLGVPAVVNQAFAPLAVQAAAPTPTASLVPDLIPIVILAVWVFGSAAVLFSWWRAWQPGRLALRRATPLRLSAPGFATSLDVRSSPDLLEPAVVGIGRSVLLLPEGIVDRLQPSELHAILAHELCHIRRRDNLTMMMHMLVEALFWFHPLVWWLEARLVDERERACDEEVLRSGNDPAVYAESILKICRLYVQSPLACASGVAGANLKQRVETIMINAMTARLSAAKRVLLATAAAAVIALPLAAGFLAAPRAVAKTEAVRGPGTALNALGTVVPLATVTMDPGVSGMLMRINFREGQMVKKGDVLAQIDPHPYETALQTSEAALARDSAAYANAQADLKRQQSQPNAGAPQRAPSVEETVHEDAAAVNADEAKVAEDRLALSYTKIIAPIDGRVGLQHADIGNMVYPGTHIVVITQLKPMSVLFLLPQDHIHPISDRLAHGAKLAVQAYDHRDQTKPVATGTLEAIDNRIDVETGTVKLRAVFNNDDGSLFPGQTVDIRVLGVGAPN